MPASTGSAVSGVIKCKGANSSTLLRVGHVHVCRYQGKIMLYYYSPSDSVADAILQLVHSLGADSSDMRRTLEQQVSSQMLAQPLKGPFSPQCQ